MRTKGRLASIGVLLAVVMVACESDRTGPLAPSPSADPGMNLGTRFAAIADPGLPQATVSLKATAPGLVSPADGSIANEPNQVLRVTNPQGTFVAGALPFDIRFEVWTVPPGPAPVHSMAVPQGALETAYTLPPAVLQDVTPYAWRSRAELDGAVGPWSEIFGFDTQFIRIDPPTPLSPINGQIVGTLRPVFTVINGTVVGDAGTVIIEIEVSEDVDFLVIHDVARTTMRDRGETNLPIRVPLEPATTYYWRARGTNENLPLTAVLPAPDVQTATDVTSDWSETETFTTAEEVTAGGGGSSIGAPFTTPGGDPPNLLNIVQQVAAQNPEALANSCQEHGGNWDFMDILVETMRAIDGRWGYNCKRGLCPDISLDVVNYYRGSGDPNGSTDVAIIDVLAGHCGPNPIPAWIDQTQPTQDAGSVGKWIYPRP